MKSIFKPIFILIFAAAVSTSCVKEDFDNPNKSIPTYELTATKTLAEILASSTGTITAFDPAANDIIEAYVTSSDEKSNFYNSISFQTIPDDGSQPIGFSVPVNLKSFTKGFTPGRKVYIKLSGLYRAIVDGSMQIGSLYQPTPNDAPKLGRISENEWQNYLFPSAVQVAEDSFVRTVSLAEAATNANLNTLVEIENVEFADSSVGRTYFDVDSGGGATNHLITDITGGTARFFRVSSYAPFSTHRVPKESGRIRGVMTRYANDFQFLIRVESDVKLTLPRVDVYPAVVGNSIQFLGSLSENFEGISVNTTVFPAYINDPVVGSRLWKVKSFGGNQFIEMSSFGGTPEVNKTMFYVPVDMTAASTFSFKTLALFYSGQTLKVYYTTNYTAGSDVNNATLVDITSNFAISADQSAFTPSGVYQIPANVTGNGFFVFEYNGSGIAPKVTTNMQIDDIVIN